MVKLHITCPSYSGGLGPEDLVLHHSGPSTHVRYLLALRDFAAADTPHLIWRGESYCFLFQECSCLGKHLFDS